MTNIADSQTEFNRIVFNDIICQESFPGVDSYEPEYGVESAPQHDMADMRTFIHAHIRTEQQIDAPHAPTGLDGVFLYRHSRFVTEGVVRGSKNNGEPSRAAGYFTQEGVDSHGVGLIDLSSTSHEVAASFMDAIDAYTKLCVENDDTPYMTIVADTELDLLSSEQQLALRELPVGEHKQGAVVAVAFDHGHLEELRGHLALLNI